MKRLLKEIGPFTPKAHPDRFATLVNSIISQQISTSAAKTIRRRFFDAVEARAIHMKQPTHSVNPANLLLFETDELREIGVSRQKANYILDLADKARSETINLKTIGRKSDEEAITELTQVKGIGRWTAQMFLMSGAARRIAGG